MKISEERRRELVAIRVTLDGKPAVIAGWRNTKFATVGQLDRPHTSHEWAWETVDYIVREKDGKFSS